MMTKIQLGVTSDFNICCEHYYRDGSKPIIQDLTCNPTKATCTQGKRFNPCTGAAIVFNVLLYYRGVVCETPPNTEGVLVTRTLRRMLGLTVSVQV